MRELSTEDFAARLAARTSAPGGGAAAAFQVAYAAALVAMVARFSDGPRFADHADTVESVVDQADAIRTRALPLADEDAAAFANVLTAFRLDRDDADRSTAIDAALAGAARPPAAVIRAAGQVIELAERMLPFGNRTVITDAAAGVEAARAAIATSRVNIEANLATVTNPLVRNEFAEVLGQVEPLLARADAVTAAVRSGLTQ